MPSIHLLSPHLCPVCNTVHKASSELSQAVRAKQSHAGTFLPIAGSGSNPGRCWGVFGSGGGAVLSASENSIPGFTVSSTTYPYVFTIGRTGWYYIGGMWQFGVGTVTDGTVTISINGAVRITSNRVDSRSHDAGTGIYLEMLLNPGDTISFASSQGVGPYTFTGTSSFSIDFVPTPQYRK